MDLRQAEYILRIAEEKNISRAAEKLFISQPALNQQLINLEKELGTPLFERLRGELKLTEAGRIYVEAAQRILDIKKDAYARISDVAGKYNAELRVGITPLSGAKIAGWVFKRYVPIHPDIRLMIYQMDTLRLQKEVFSGGLDFAIGTVAEKDEKRGEYVTLRTMEMLMVMSKEDPHLKKTYIDEVGRRRIDFAELKDEHFALGPGAGTSHLVENRLFDEAGFAPMVYHQGGAFPLRLSMVELNTCCTFMEEHYQEMLPDTVEKVYLSERPKLESAIIYKKGRHLSMAERDFINLARLYWESNIGAMKEVEEGE